MKTADVLEGANSMLAFDVERVRADFPILHQEIYGRPLVYLDNGASAQCPRQVIDGMSEVYETIYANVHRGVHYLSQRSTDAFEGAREKVASFVNAATSDEIVFARGTTEASNRVADNEWPPRSKKSSCSPMLRTPRISVHSAAMEFSVSVAGGSDAFTASDQSGSGNACRSIFPFAVNGSSSRANIGTWPPQGSV